jgi:hypothetical protein
LKEKKPPFYIYMDIEGAGPALAFHSVLSWAACAVTPEPYTKLGLQKRGLLFYDELRPTSSAYEMEAMRVGCLGLRCLELLRVNPEYDPSSSVFRPELVLKILEKMGTSPVIAVEKLHGWIESVVPVGFRPELVTDTVIYDASQINYYFSIFGSSLPRNPFGHSGLDIDSYCRGLSQSRSASLRQLGIVDDRVVPHCAEDDAIYGAKLARELLFRRSKP